MRRKALLFLLAALAAPPALAQPTPPLRASVTSVTARTVYLDQGRNAGITPGLRVRFFPSGRDSFEGIVREVSASSARVEIPLTVRVPPIGTEAEMDIPVQPAEQPPPTEPAPAPKAPEHPPWTLQEGDRAADAPLLAPALSRPAKERPTTFHGRAYTQLQYSIDHGGGRDNTYLLARLGTNFEVTNPIGQGGRFLFDAELDSRLADLGVYGSESENDLILNNLSYAIGGEQYSSYRVEAGRFTSVFLPEIGLIDGVEGAVQLENGLRIGAGGGVYPLAFPDRDWGSDLGFHLFVDYQPTDSRVFSGTLGYQKTWHNGDADRDAFIARANYNPTDTLWFYGSFTVDLYTADDTVKGNGLQLTEAWAQARYMPNPGTGASVSYSHYTWPETKQDDFIYVPISLLEDGRIDRVDLSAWHDIGKDFRLTGRLDYWTDQAGDGLGGEVDFDWDRIFNSAVALHTAVFYSDGSYIDGMGFRVEARPGSGDLQGLIGYQYFRYQTKGMVSGSEYFTEHTLRAGVSWQVNRWYYNLTAEHYFGDSEDAYTLGAYIEVRF